jgi:hypothetical protein
MNDKIRITAFQSEIVSHPDPVQRRKAAALMAVDFLKMATPHVEDLTIEHDELLNRYVVRKQRSPFPIIIFDYSAP